MYICNQAEPDLYSLHMSGIFIRSVLTLVLLNPDIPSLCCKQLLLQKPTDLDLHCLPLSILIYSNNADQAIRSGCGILIYSAGQGLNAEEIRDTF